MKLLELTSERPDAAINALIQATINEAARYWEPEAFGGEYPKTGFGIGRLTPKDVFCPSDATTTGAWTRSTGWGVSIAAASTWQDWIDVTTSDSAFFIVTGIFCLDAIPNVTHIRPHVDGNDWPIVDIQEMYTFQEPKAYFSKPFAIRPEKKFKMRVIGTAAGVAKLGLLGFKIAKRSYLISE